MLPESEEARIRAIWDKKASVPELVEMLGDHREWSSGGYANFDGDATVTICMVSETAVHALASIAPQVAPLTLVAKAVARSHRRIHEVRTYSWTSPLELEFRWTMKMLEPFGAGLLEALHALMRDDEPEVQQRAEIVLDDLATSR